MKKVFLLFISLVALLSAHSQAGSLDPSFAGKGWTTTDFSTGNFLDESGRQVLLQNNGTYLVVVEINDYTVLARFLSKSNALDKSFGTQGYSVPIQIQRPKVALQSDGKIVVAGGAYDPATGNENFGLARFNPNGSLDVSFGTNGMQTTDFGSYDYATSVAIQSDGKIVVAGSTYDPATGNEDFGLARYTTSGLLDDTFSEDGKQTTDFFGSYDYANGIVIQSDGKIVVSGGVYDPANSSEDFGLARYTTAGLLDDTFSEDGKQTTDFFGSYDYTRALALQSDGKIVVAGMGYNPATGSDDFGLARYTTSGSLDDTFSEDGKQTTDFGNLNEYARALAIQSDGKIVVAGGVYDPATNNEDFGLARYNTNGSLDNTFDVDGRQTTDFGNSYDYVTGVAIQNDGKIVVVGEVENSTTDNEDIGLARYNTNGSLDRNFDRDGKLSAFYPASDATFYAIAVQSDGKIVIAGRAKNVSDNFDFALARYNADGSLDRNFNRSGKQTTDFFGRSDYAYAIALQSDGKIVVAGRSYDPATENEDIALVRYNTNGSLDKTFSGDGKQTTDFFGSSDQANGIAIQSDGKIVVAGEVYDPATDNNDFGLARYSTAGSLDNTFDVDGKQTTDFGSSYDYANSVAIQSDGKIVVAGGVYDPATGSEDIGLVRYSTAGLLDNDFSEDGKQTTDFGNSYDYARGIAIQSDGKIVVAGGVYDPATNNEDFALARYNTNGLLDDTFSEDGKQTTDFRGDNNNATALAIRNNKLYVGGRYRGLMRSGAVAVYSLGTIPSAPQAITIASAKGNSIAKEQNLAQTLTVKTLSNPSANYFTLVTKSNSPKTLSVRVVDEVGRQVEGRSGLAPGGTLRIGHTYRPGVYYAQVVQGGEMVTLKLVKQ